MRRRIRKGRNKRSRMSSNYPQSPLDFAAEQRPQYCLSKEKNIDFGKRSRSLENVTKSSHGHYRLNLGDIPFVVGKVGEKILI